MTTHNHGRVSPFGHPRINAHQATPRGLTQPITSFIGLAYQGIHHAPQKQKTQTIIFTHRQQKIPRTKPQKRKNKQQPLNCCFFIAFASTIQFSHNTPPQQTTPNHMRPTFKGRNQQKGLAHQRGDSLEQQPCVAPDTQQHAKQQNKPKHKHTLLKPSNQQGRKTAKAFASSTPTTPHAHKTTCGTCFHLKIKTCHHQAPNQHRAMTKNLPLTRR